MLDLVQGLGGFSLCSVAALAQNFHDGGGVLCQLLTAGTDGLQGFLQDVVEELLHLYVAQTAPLVVGLQLVQIGVIRQVAGKVLVGAEGVQI